MNIGIQTAKFSVYVQFLCLLCPAVFLLLHRVVASYAVLFIIKNVKNHGTYIR